MSVDDELLICECLGFWVEYLIYVLLVQVLICEFVYYNMLYGFQYLFFFEVLVVVQWLIGVVIYWLEVCFCECYEVGWIISEDLLVVFDEVGVVDFELLVMCVLNWCDVLLVGLFVFLEMLGVVC